MNEEQERKWCVYKHTNKINGKVYIGQTCLKITDRWLHGKGYVGCTYFYNAIQKYGWDNFEHEILFENLTKEKANELEKQMIKDYNSMDKEYGYNLMSGGVYSQPCDETKEKMRKAHSGKNNHFYGKHHTKESIEKIRQKKLGSKLSEETKAKISKGNKGKIVSEETRRKIGETHKGLPGFWKGKHLPEETKQKIREAQKGEKSHNWGKQRTDEEKQKISQRLKGHPVSKETREKISKAHSMPVRCIETGIVYYGISEAARQLGGSSGNLVAHLKGRQKTFCGYHWEYVEGESVCD